MKSRFDLFFTTEASSEIINIHQYFQIFSDYSLDMLREDQTHPTVSGNKYRKLKYNILEAQRLKKKSLLTFGGAYSNHIAATAAAGKEVGLKTIGIIRGEELSEKVNNNPTLAYAKSCGMELEFITREAYKKKTSFEFMDRLTDTFGDFYLLPEGGTNEFAIKGCKEILNGATAKYDYICVPVGTGGTLAGILEAAAPYQQIIGFSALKGAFQQSEIKKFTNKQNFQLTDAYCFGGYAKIDSELVRFINKFKDTTGVPLDPVYTGKMLYGIRDLMSQGYFKKNSRILAVHTGGLQGIYGMNQQLKKKNLPTIK